MNVPENLLYTKDHEWILIEDDTATIGITEYAAGELGDIVFIEMPEIGDEAIKSEAVANIEAVKAVSDMYAPVSGEVSEINDTLEDDPQQVNQAPFGNGWIIKIKLSDKGELDTLLSPADYKALIG